MPNSAHLNPQACREYRERVNSDPDRLARRRAKDRERARRWRAKRSEEPGVVPACRDRPAGFIDREPCPDDPLAQTKWEWLRGIRQKEIEEGRAIYNPTDPDELVAYRTRFGIDLQPEQTPQQSAIEEALDELELDFWDFIEPLS